MASPYSHLPPRAFWKTGVSQRAPLDPGDLYRPKFRIPADARVMTAGSCFAQHIGQALRSANLNIIDTEPLPKFISDDAARAMGFRQFSARYGNIYTTSQLVQLFREARGKKLAEPVWQRQGRFFDAQRPAIEPEGFDTAEEVLRHRRHHLVRVAKAMKSTNLLIFTFGLTEAWIHRETGTVYPTAPGTICGSHDPEVYAFVNYDYAQVMQGFLDARAILRRGNKDMRFIITVSPVPLTATASGNHIEVANSYSKSVLRAVCGALAQAHDDIDYYPSYEIITSLNNRGVYYEANKRNVTPDGVAQAMSMFLNAHGLVPSKGEGEGGSDDPHCDDALLEAFAR